MHVTTLFAIDRTINTSMISKKLLDRDNTISIFITLKRFYEISYQFIIFKLC